MEESAHVIVISCAADPNISPECHMIQTGLQMCPISIKAFGGARRSAIAQATTPVGSY